MANARTMLAMHCAAACFPLVCRAQPEPAPIQRIYHVTFKPPDSVQTVRPVTKLLFEGRYGEARTELAKNLREAEEHGSGRQSVGDILDELGTTEYLDGRYKASLRYYERLQRHWEGVPQEEAGALNSVGLTLLALGETTRAEKALRRSIEISPGAGRPWHLLGQALYIRGRMREAEEAQLTAIRLADAGDIELIASSRNDLAVICETAGRFAEGIEFMEQAIAIVPKGQVRARMTAGLALMNWKAERREQALELLERARAEMEAAVGRGHEDLQRVVMTHARVLKEMGRKKEAKEMEAELVSGVR